MEFTNIISAVLAGGISGQIVTLVWGNSLIKKREFNKWLVTERYKLYSEFLTLITHVPKEQEELNKWTYKIRDISQRIHILFNEGTAPKELKKSMENIFQLARKKKERHGI